MFAAIQDLITNLANNNEAGITTATDSLKLADKHLNGQVAFYGTVQNRVQEATDLAGKFQTQHQTELSQLRDADIPALAVQLSQLQVQREASMAVEANVARMKNLFDFLA